MKTRILAVLAILILSAGPAAAQVLLQVDLSVTDQITITATAGNSAATVSGSDVTGVYLEGFFGAAGNSLSNNLVSGNLTSAANATDNTPSLYRDGAGADPGLNVWSMSSDADLDFTSGAQAFTGSGTWTLTNALYMEMVNNAPASGNLWFPADTVGDLAGATQIGTYAVSGAAPAGPATPLPVPTMSTYGLVLMALALLLVAVGPLRRV